MKKLILITITFFIFQNHVESQEVTYKQRSIVSFANHFRISKTDLTSDRIFDTSIKTAYEAKRGKYQDTIKTLLAESKKLTNIAKIKNLKDKAAKYRDSINMMTDSIKKFEREIFKIEIVNGKGRLFIPVKNSNYSEVFSELMYSTPGFSLVDNIIIQAQNDKGSIYSELISGYIGPVRIGFGSLIAAAADTLKQDQALQRFIGGGGNAVLKVEYPIFFYTTKNFVSLLQAAPKIGVDIPVMGTRSDVTTYNINFALELYLALSTEKKEFNFFANVRTGFIFGGDKFYSNLGIENTPFTFGQINIGFTISNIKISIIAPIFSSNSKLRNTPPSIGGVLIPIKKS
jgi:hypothetical protein